MLDGSGGDSRVDVDNSLVPPVESKSTRRRARRALYHRRQFRRLDTTAPLDADCAGRLKGMAGLGTVWFGRPMRVGYDLSILRRPAAGTARYAVELLRAMRETEPRETIVEFQGWPRTRRGPSPVRRGTNLASEVGWLTVGSMAIAVRHRLDVWFAPANVVPLLLPRPSVVTVHDVNILDVAAAYDGGYAAYAERVVQRSVRRARVVLTDSEYSRGRIVARLGVDPDRVVVAYPGIDHVPTWSTDAPRATLGLPRDYALFVGQTEPHKNVGALVEAWPSCPPDLDLVIAGRIGRDEAALAAKIDGSPARLRIHRLIDVAEAELGQVYGGARMFLFPSRAEGFGLPPLEAMRLGVPTAVADAGSLPEVTRGGALLFDPSEPATIADVVHELHCNDDVRRQLESTGRHVASQYRWASTADVAWSAIRAAAQ